MKWRVAVSLFVLASACDSTAPSGGISLIAYTCSLRLGEGLHICTNTGDGTNRTLLIESGTSSTGIKAAMEPAWSSDGRRLAYVAVAPGADELSLWIANADGTGRVEVSTDTARLPNWSPDGARIAFASNHALKVVNLDGTGLTTIVERSMGVDRPSWSPDGSRIAFGTLFGAGGIYTIRPDGADLQRLTTQRDGHPAYSHDGSKLAIVAYQAGIDVMDANGSNRSRVHEDFSGTYPAWSPFDDEIAFTDFSGPGRVWIFPAAGGATRPLEFEAHISSAPSWALVHKP